MARPSDAYSVVSPLARLVEDTFTPGAPLPDLRGKVVVELWDWLFRGSEIFPLVREQLRARFPGVRFVEYTAFGNIHRGGDVLEVLPTFLRAHKADAVISAMGA